MGGKQSKSSARRRKSRHSEPEMPQENPTKRRDQLPNEEVENEATSTPQDPGPQRSRRRHRRGKGKRASVNGDEASDHQSEQHSLDSDSIVSRSSRRRHRRPWPAPEAANPPLPPAHSLQQPENNVPMEYGNPYPALYTQNENNNFPIGQPQQEMVSAPTIYNQLFSSNFPYGIPEQRISEVGEIWRIKSGVPVSYTRYCKY